MVAPELALIVSSARRRRIPVRSLALPFALLAAVAIALVPLALAQRGTGHADYIAQGALSTRLLQVPKQFLVGFASPGQALTGVLAALIVVTGALWPLVAQPGLRRRAALPLIIGSAAVFVPVLMALVGVDFLNTRNLLPALPPLAIAAAIGFAAESSVGRLRPTPGAFAVALAAVSIVIVALVDTHPRYQRPDWRGAAGALSGPLGARAIDIEPASGLIPLEAYIPRLSRMTTSRAVTEFDIVALPAEASGGGLGPPPRPARPPGIPPGFTLFRETLAGGYTVLRYRSPVPRTLTPAGVAR